MLPWKLLDEAPVPGGDDHMRFSQRGDEFSIRVGGYELMNSRISASERALGARACTPLANRSGAQVLIGGLGMGFTLAAALQVLGADANVVVAELVPAVVRWNRGPLGQVAAHPLQDARVEVQEGDVGHLIARASGRYDAILLDVDNGPEGLTRAANDKLYDLRGLRAARTALTPKGTFWTWSAAPRPRYVERLKRAGFWVDEHVVRAADGKRRGSRHLLWEARTP